MKEVKSPKKPLAFYYLIILAALLLFNVLVMPSIASKQAKEVDYGTFMSMIEKKNIGDVEIKDSEIVFTDKKETKIYKTGVMDDPTLTERLYDSGAKFTKDIQQTTSPMLSMLLSLILWGVGELLWQVNVSQIMIISSILAFASMWLFICQTVVYVVYKGYEVLKQLHAKKLQRGDTT